LKQWVAHAQETTAAPRKEAALAKAPAPRRAIADDGFLLIEVMVAMVVFAVISTAVLGTVLTSLATARSDRGRVTAANLAARELEITRSQFQSPAAGPKTIATGKVSGPNPLPGGVAGAPLVVDGMAYTLVRSAAWQSQGASAGPCDGGASGQLAYLRVTVTVSWPRMSGVLPVTSSTLLTPTVGTYSASTGHVKVKVTDGNNVPEAGQFVTVTGPSGTTTQETAADGCAFFAFLSPGSYVATVLTPGYVDPSWVATPSQTVTVTANTVQPVSFTYAPSATLNLSFTSPLGLVASPNTTVTLYNTGLPSSTRTRAVLGLLTPRTVNLWPYPDGVIAWAGGCLDADPQGYAGGVRASPLITNPGVVTNATVNVAPVLVTVRNKLGVLTSGVQVVAVHAADTGCPATVTDPLGGTAGEVLTLPGLTSSAGTIGGSLPYGTWKFKVVISGQATTVWPTAILAPLGPSPAAVLVNTK
jgi:prepilin-type N-terminal cleavage/methylation domain-containing protein